MSIAHKLALFCTAALAVMAFGSASASAENILIEDEASDTACNPCIIQITGESELHTETGIRISTCQDRFEAEIYNAPTGEVEPHTPGLNHWGHVYHYVTNNHPTKGFTCTRGNCLADQGPENESEWPIANITETGNEHVQLTVRFCLRQIPNPVGVHCNAVVNLAEDHPDHHSILTTNHHCAGLGVKWAGFWEIDDTSHHDELRFHHAS